MEKRREKLKVMKFGGACLKDKTSLLKVAEIAKTEKEDKILVISAIFNVTDSLLNSLQKVKTNEHEISIIIEKIRKVHETLAKKSIKDKKILETTIKSINTKINKLERPLYGVSYTEELTDRTKALILSFGERLSVLILEGVLQSKGINAKALESDEIGLVTDSSFDNATAILPLVNKNFKRTVHPLVKRGITPIITGYFGCTLDKKTTTFGRNSSDYSAAVIANAMNASVLEIWKDVDGFMNADPKIVKSAYKIDTLSYYEAAELSYFGAKILHPRTVEPLTDLNILIFIKNIHNPEDAGTKICKRGYKTKDILKSVTYNKNVSVLKIQGAGVGYKPGIISEVGSRLADARINIYSIITSQTCINLLLDRKDLAKSYQIIKQLRGGVIEKVESIENIALVAVVGEGLLKTHGLAAKVFAAVAKEKVNVEMISVGASEVAYYFIINNKDLEKTINVIHNEYFKNNSQN